MLRLSLLASCLAVAQKRKTERLQPRGFWFKCTLLHHPVLLFANESENRPKSIELYPRPALLRVIPDPERNHRSNAAERAKHDSPGELFPATPLLRQICVLSMGTVTNARLRIMSKERYDY
jgi:hypothetical protein